MTLTRYSGNSWKKPLDSRRKIWQGVEIAFSGLVVLGALGLWLYCIALCREMMIKYEAFDPAAVQRSE